MAVRVQPLLHLARHGTRALIEYRKPRRAVNQARDSQTLPFTVRNLVIPVNLICQISRSADKVSEVDDLQNLSEPFQRQCSSTCCVGIRDLLL